MPRIRRGRRRAFAVQVSMKRPIDKKLLSFTATLVGAGGLSSSVLYLATFPGTITGIRWDLLYQSALSTQTTPGFGPFLITIIRDGVTAPAVSYGTFATPANLMVPEQNCLVAGNWYAGSYSSGECGQYQGTTKTQRKLMGGDTIQFHTYNVGVLTTGDVQIRAIFQFFVKS